MSTSYYNLREPVTHIRPEVMGGHTHVGIWINHGKAGTLVFRNEEWEQGIWLFVNHVDSLIVEEFDDSLRPDQQMVSEYSELITVREIRAEAGKGKK